MRSKGSVAAETSMLGFTEHERKNQLSHSRTDTSDHGHNCGFLVVLTLEHKR